MDARYPAGVTSLRSRKQAMVIRSRGETPFCGLAALSAQLERFDLAAARTVPPPNVGSPRLTRWFRAHVYYQHTGPGSLRRGEGVIAAKGVLSSATRPSPLTRQCSSHRVKTKSIARAPLAPRATDGADAKVIRLAALPALELNPAIVDLDIGAALQPIAAIDVDALG